MSDSSSELNAKDHRQKALEEEIGAIVTTEHGERYRRLVIDNSGDHNAPTSV